MADLSNVPASPSTPLDAVPAASEQAGGTLLPDRPRGRRRFRRRWLVLLLGLVAIVAIAAVQLPQWLSPTPSATIWETITGSITNGVVPKQTALEAFAYVFKVDIPDVTVPAGVDGGDEPTSTTGVMRWVQANWSVLTPDQQAVIDRYLPPASNAGTIPMTSGPTAIGSGSVAQPRFELTKAISWPMNVNIAPDASTDLALAMADEVAADIAHIGPKLGMAVIARGSLALPNITFTMSDTDGGNGLFLTQAREPFGQYSPCNITAWKNAWQNEGVTSNGGVSPQLHVLITHEVVHCYQNVVWGNVATALAIPPWIGEGTALYLAADDTGIAEPIIPSMWKNGYLKDPETPLTNRSYDAFGYYSLLAHEGRDLWSLMLPAWQAAAKGPERSNAYIAVLKGDDPDIRGNWAESYVDETAWSDPWILYGFGAPASADVFQHPVQAQTGAGWEGSLLSRSNTLLNVNGTSGEVVTVTTDGLASVHDNNGNSAVAFQTQSFCNADAGCVCPPGTLLAGQDMASQKLTIPFVTALNAPEGGSKYAIIAYTLDDLCQHPPTPAPTVQPKGPCGPSCTNSNGDPHMRTVNQYVYDFQAAGEFTLLRSADGSVDIQARQEPFGSGSVSINTAIAAQAGGHKVGVYMTTAGLVAHVDGQVADLSGGPKDLGGGAQITEIAKGYEIDFPDGTKLWTLAVGQWGINAQIKPSDSLAKTGVGLLGTIVPGGLGVPALPDGTRLPVANSAAQRASIVYGQFADAWRLTDATTLFDYDPGKTTATYTIKPYPTNPKYTALSDLSSDQTTAGDSACSTITDPALHDDCVFDVGVTGQTGFATSYAATQSFYDSGFVAATEPPVSFAPATPASGVVAGAATVTQGTQVGGYAIGANDIVYMSVQTGDNRFSLIAFDPKAGKIVTQVDEPSLTRVHFAAGSVWLPGLKTDANGHNCSITRVDATTLAEQATVPTPCSAFGSVDVTASDGDAVWFVDYSKLDLSTSKGAVFTRIDPTTNAPGTSVPLPAVGGYALDSQGAFFYFTTSDETYYRLVTGSTAFDSLGIFKTVPRPAGTGLWSQDNTNTTANYYTQADTPQATVQVGGNIVGGDTTAVYTDVFGNGPSGTPEDQLWRYPIDGSTPTQIAAGPTIGGNSLGYTADPQPISNADGFLKIWPTRVGSQQLLSILLQWTPVHP